MLGQINPKAKDASVRLRKTMTDAERKLWSRLRSEQLGVKFRRQHPFLRYVLDFVCLERKLVIEVDGSQHMESQAHDLARTTGLEEAGFVVLRFWNNDVLNEANAVVEKIFEVLEPHPHPSPPLEGEGVKWRDCYDQASAGRLHRSRYPGADWQGAERRLSQYAAR